MPQKKGYIISAICAWDANYCLCPFRKVSKPLFSCATLAEILPRSLDIKRGIGL